MIRKFLLLGLLLIYCGQLSPASDKRAGTAAFQFLNIVPGAREASLGGTLAHSNNVNNIFHNPAGMAQIDRMELGLSHNRWIADITQQTAAGVYPSAYGNLGIGILYLHVGEIKGYDIDGLGNPVKISDFSPYDLLIVGNYSRKFPWFSAGANIKLFREEIEEVQAEGFAADIGISGDLTDKLSLGMSVNNIGAGVKFIDEEEELPLNFRFGAAYCGIINNLITSADILIHNHNEPEASFGAEYLILERAALRAGYKYGNDLSQNFSGGVGFTVSDWTVDYAFLPFGDLGNNHRVSILYRFSKSPAEDYVRPVKAEEAEVTEPAALPEEKPEDPEPLEDIYDTDSEETEDAQPLEEEEVFEESVELLEEEIFEEPAEPEKIREIYVTGTWAEKRECLWNIAERIYGDPLKWTKIFKANKDIISDPDLIQPGLEIYLPDKR